MALNNQTKHGGKKDTPNVYGGEGGELQNSEYISMTTKNSQA